MRNQPTRLIAAVVLVCFTLAIAALSSTDFYIARGSDAGASVYRVSRVVSTVSVAAVLAAFLAATLAEMFNPVQRALLGSLGLVVLALATHVVSFNFHAESVDEYWFALRIPRATLNAADGLEAAWYVRQDILTLVLTHRTSNEEVHVFTGAPPWSVDCQGSADVIGLSSADLIRWFAHPDLAHVVDALVRQT